MEWFGSFCTGLGDWIPRWRLLAPYLDNVRSPAPSLEDGGADAKPTTPIQTLLAFRENRAFPGDKEYLSGIQLDKESICITKDGYQWSYSGDAPENYLVKWITGLHGDDQVCLETEDGSLRKCFQQLQGDVRYHGEERGGLKEFLDLIREAKRNPGSSETEA